MENLEIIKKTFRQTLLVQVMMCLIYVIIYFVDENNIGNGFIMLFSIIVISVILARIYIKSDKKETEKIKRFIITSIIWIIENTIIGLASMEIAPGWWPLTYMILIGYFTMAPIVFVLVFKIICFTYEKIKALVNQ